MLNGIEGKAIPVHLALPYADVCESVAERNNFPPCLLYAISFRESIGEYGWDAATCLSDNGDGGHGIGQLTSSFPPDWESPTSNYQFMLSNFLMPAYTYWVGQGERGDNLAKLVAASYNAGLGGAIQGHLEGNADLNTTNQYGENVVRIMHQLLDGQQPTL